jgi:putative restriction endonuclease
MRARIGRYRRTPIGVGEDSVIGCLFVRDVRFFPDDAVAGPPPQFARNIVQGKSYDLADPAVGGFRGYPAVLSAARCRRRGDDVGPRVGICV